jgi:hypothetical protein
MSPSTPPPLPPTMPPPPLPPAFPPAECQAELEPAVTFPATTTDAVGSLAAGRIEFGQTHVTDANETRIHARRIQLRETLLLYTPEQPLPPDAPLIVGVFASQSAAAPLLGSLRLLPPNSTAMQRELLEQPITGVRLAPYSTSAWVSVIPWAWVREGVLLSIVRRDSASSGVLLKKQELSGLGAPHPFAITRSKLVLFANGSNGQPQHTSAPADRVSYDYFPTLPFASLRWTDALGPVQWPCMQHAALERMAARPRNSLNTRPNSSSASRACSPPACVCILS